jgi:hypothetical protein
LVQGKESSRRGEEERQRNSGWVSCVHQAIQEFRATEYQSTKKTSVRHWKAKKEQ